MPEKPKTAYSELPLTGPDEVGVGHALITMVEPHPGLEREYNRWYEDDHFFSGALFTPWMFAGRRWTATRDLQELRYPEHSPIADPVTAGAYLGTYWIAPGRVKDQNEWIFAATGRLTEEGRIYTERTHVFTSFQDHASTIYRDESIPRDVYSLMDPAPGLVLEVLDARSPEAREDLERWLIDDYLPQQVPDGGPVSSVMVFRTNPPDPYMKAAVTVDAEVINNGGRRLTLLWFLLEDPRSIWDSVFLLEGDRIADGGLGEVSLIAPFIPSKMGTNTYDDQLRAAPNK